MTIPLMFIITRDCVYMIIFVLILIAFLWVL